MFHIKGSIGVAHPFSVVHEGSEKAAVAAVCEVLGVNELPEGTSIGSVTSLAGCCDLQAQSFDDFVESRKQAAAAPKVEAEPKPTFAPVETGRANDLSKIGDEDQPANKPSKPEKKKSTFGRSRSSKKD